MRLLALTLLIAWLAALLSPVATGEELVIVVTFAPLKGDVERLLCGYGVVYVLVPAGVDPHEYQLTPRDVELLEQAKLVVSTGHTHFELKIREMVESGELRAELLEVTGITGLKVLANPVTGQPNYHMPIRDPVNYVLFVLEVAKKLSQVDPARSGCYAEKALEVAREVLSAILPARDSQRGLVVADKPHAQYAAEWLGYSVAWIVRYEEEAQVTPESARRAEELAESGSLAAVFVTDPPVAQESQLLLEIARAHKLPVVYVPSPASTTSTLEALKAIAEQVSKLKPPEQASQAGQQAGVGAGTLLALATGLVGFAGGLVAGYLIAKRGVKRA